MNRTTRNTLMIGGALIVIALLLFCGPLTGRFGGGGQKVDDTPSVAAGPPVGAPDVAAAAAVGALVGGSIAETEATGLDTSSADEELPAVAEIAANDSNDALVAAAAVATAGAATGAAVAADGPGGTGGGSEMPPVSSGLPIAPLAVSPASDLADAEEVRVAATQTFDNSRGDAGGIGSAGSRFAPPVAAPGDSNFGFAQIDGLGNGGVLRPCDSPGSGCRNLNRPTGPNRIPNPGLTRGGRRNIVP